MPARARTTVPEDPPEPEPTSREVTLGELVVLGGVGVVAVVAVVSLGLALLGWHDLPQVAAVSAGLLALAGWAAVHQGGPRVRVEGRELAALVVTGLVALGMFLPGFPYAAGDRDPGVYVIHGMAIAREGATHFPDELAELAADGELPLQPFGPGSRFPGLWEHPDDATRVLPQFYHLYPALLGTAHDVAGPSAVFHLNPLLATAAVLAVLLATRRAFGWTPALVAAALLSTNMLQVWQAKYPTTEILTQLFVAGALLALMVAIDTGWRPPAGLAGLLVGASWLARPDAVLVVLMGLAVAAALVALERADARVWWALAGGGLLVPMAVYQAYVLNEEYSSKNDVPALSTLAAIVAVLTLGTVIGRRLLPPLLRVARRMAPRVVDHGQPVLGGLLVAGLAVILLLAWNRQTLLRIDMFVRNREVIRSYDEANLIRLSWYLTVAGLVMVVGGTAVVGLSRWQARRWVLVAPGLALFPLYLWAARISPQMMWWGRRFVPMVLVSLVVLMAVAIGWLLQRGGARQLPLRILGVVSLIFLVVTYLGQSWPLRAHREYGGTYDFVGSVAAVAGDQQGVFLWQPSAGIFDLGSTFGGSVWFIEDQLSAFLPSASPPDPWIDTYLAVLGDEHPIFVVTRRDEVPTDIDVTRLEPVATVRTEAPFWEETWDRRPSHSRAELEQPIIFWATVWRVTGPSSKPTDDVPPAEGSASRDPLPADRP